MLYCMQKIMKILMKFDENLTKIWQNFAKIHPEGDELLAGVEDAGEAEVDKLRSCAGDVRGRQHDVVGLDVAMKDAPRVRLGWHHDEIMGLK